MPPHNETRRHIFAAKAAERDYFCFTDISQDAWLDFAFTPEQVLRTYDEQHDPHWVAEPLDRCIVSLCRYTYPDRDRTIFVSLSYEGDVGFIGKQEGHYEKIPGAGVDGDDAEYGSMTRIRQIGRCLYAVGMNGQIYRRDRPNTWSHVDDGILQSPDSKPSLILEDIAGMSETSLFVVGSGGFIGWFDGKRWTKIDATSDESLRAILVEDAQTVWICGRNGTLLKGNEKVGFTALSRAQDTDTFLSIATYDGKIFLGTRNGVSVYGGATIEPVVTGLRPELRDGHVVDAVDGVLWSFGYSDVARFDGTRWRRYPTPPVPDERP